MIIAPSVEQLLPELKRHRRALHRIPEAGLSEYRTQRYIMDALQALQPDYLAPCADTGVKAVFKGTGRIPALAFRADMDALGIQEANTHGYVSQHPGMMHACGHDGHMSMLLTLAGLIAQGREKLQGDVVLLFQPAEETVGGAARMIKDGALENPKVEAIFALHMMPDLPLGKIGTCIGPLMAQTCEVDITLTGASAHGAMPHKGVDAIAAAAHLYTLIQTQLSRCIDPYEQALLTVGKLTAGEQRNILASQAKLECTARTFSEDTYVALRTQLQRALAGVEQVFGVKTQLTENAYYPCVHNPEALTRRAMAAAGDALVLVRPKMIAEDFSFFQQAIPGVFLFLGCMDEAHSHPLHASCFDFDENALLYGVQLLNTLIPWQ